MQRKHRKPGKKAVARAECLARLKGGATPAELVGEFSPGPVYDAVKEYLSYAAGEVEGARRSREKELQELARVKEEGRVASEVAAARKAEVESLKSRLSKLDEEVKTREHRVTNLKQSVERLESKAWENLEKGITEQMFHRLDRFDFGKEDELIERLATAERYKGFVVEMAKKSGELSDLTGKVKVLRGEKAKLDDEVLSLRSVRDEELSKNFVQSESIKILSSFYEDGYTSDDIDGLRIGLNTLGIREDPKTSVRRLIDLLGGELELSKLMAEIMVQRDELDVLVNNVERVKGQLSGYKDVAIANLSKAETVTRAKIEGIYDEAVDKVKSFGETAEKQIQTVSRSNIAAIDAASKHGIGNLIDVHNQAKLEIEDTVDQIINDVRTTIRSEFEPYHKTLKILPMMQPFAEYGFLFMRLSMDKSLAEKIPPVFVSLMANSIDVWVKEKLPEASTIAPKDVKLIAPALGIEMPSKLYAITTWLRQELADKTRF